jgi:hypothetical protein
VARSNDGKGYMVLDAWDHSQGHARVGNTRKKVLA